MPRRYPKQAIAELCAVAALTALAALLRLPSIAELPPGLQGDEAWLGLEAQRILRDGPIGIWTHAGWGQPAGVFYWTALAFALLPDSVTVLRGSVAVLGIATVPALYLFVRSFFGWRAALMAAALLSVSYWHIHYSRTAYTLIAAPLVECIVLLLLARGVRSGRSWPFLASGLIAGLGVYTYKGYPFFVLLLGVVWIALLLRRPYPPRWLLRHFALFAVPAVLVAMPMAVFVLTHYDDYMGYAHIASVFGEYWREHAVSIFFVGREADKTDGLGTIGLLDPLTAALFALGLALAVWKWKDWRYLTVVAGVLLGIAAVALTASWGENRRGIAGLPMVFAAAGIAGDVMVASAWRWRTRLRVPLRERAGTFAAAGALVAVLAFSTAWNSWNYFGEIVTSDAMHFAFAADLSQASEFLASLDEETHVYFYSDRWSWDYKSRRFRSPDLTGEDRSREFGTFGLEHAAGQEAPVAYLLMPPYDRHADEIAELYPGGRYVRSER